MSDPLSMRWKMLKSKKSMCHVWQNCGWNASTLLLSSSLTLDLEVLNMSLAFHNQHISIIPPNCASPVLDFYFVWAHEFQRTCHFHHLTIWLFRFLHPPFLHLALKMVNFSCGTSLSQFLPINMSTFLREKGSFKDKSIFLPCLLNCLKDFCLAPIASRGAEILHKYFRNVVWCLGTLGRQQELPGDQNTCKTPITLPPQCFAF